MSHEPIDALDAIRAAERHRVAQLMREEAGALSRYRRENPHDTPSSPVTATGAFALAAWIEAQS